MESAGSFGCAHSKSFRGLAFSKRVRSLVLGLLLSVLALPGLAGEDRNARAPVAVAVRFPFTINGRIGWFSRGRLLLSSESPGDPEWMVDFSRRNCTVRSRKKGGGPERKVWQKFMPLKPGAHTLVLRLTNGKMRLILDHRNFVEIDAPLFGRIQAGFTPTAGISADERPRIQRLAPLFVDDDFSRLQAVPELWEVQSGFFTVTAKRDPETSQDAFQYFARPIKKKGLVLAGVLHWFWDDYRLGVSARMDRESGGWGLIFHAVDKENYAVAVWQQAADGGPGTLRLLRHEKGRNIVLAETPLKRMPGQWNRMDVFTVNGQVSVRVNGIRRLFAEDPGFAGGRVGLLVQDAAAVFDDFRVRSIERLPTARAEIREPFGPIEHAWSDFSKKSFFADPFMVQWAHPRALWEKGEGATGERVFRTQYFHDVAFAWQNGAGSSCQWPEKPIRIELMAARKKRGSGYGVRITADTLALQRNGTQILQHPLKSKALATLRCEVADGRVRVAVNGQEKILWQDPAPLTSGWVRAELGEVHDLSVRIGARVLRLPDWRDHAVITSRHRLDYNFAFAPAAWKRQSGQWRSTNRWGCVPLWSFFSGRGAANAPGIPHGNCLLWSRRTFSGDFDLEFFLSPLEGTRQRVHFSYPVTLNVAFAADGRQLDSGYLLLFGVHDLPTRLYRHGKLLAESKALVIPLLRRQAMRCYHRLSQTWQHLRIQRQGKKITVWAARHDDRGNDLGLEKLFSAMDPQPLTGGRLGLWTWGDNGMAIARASASFEQSRVVGDPAMQGLDPMRSSRSREMTNATAPENARKFQRVSNTQPGGTFCFDLLTQPRLLREHERLFFAFRPGPEPLAVSLQALVRGQVAEASLVGPAIRQDRMIPLGAALTAVPEPGNWGRAELPLTDRFRQFFPKGPLTLTRLVIASPYATTKQIAGQGVNRQGANYDVGPLQWQVVQSPGIRAKKTFHFSIRGLDPLADFATGPGSWRTLGGWDGAALHCVPAAGPDAGAALCLLNRRIGGPAGAWAVETPYNLSAFPQLDFYYRFSPSIEVNLLVKANGNWYEITASGLDHLWPIIGRIPDFQADHNWHHTRIKLYEWLQARLKTRVIQIDALAWGDTFRMSSQQNTAWWIASFCRVPAIPPEKGVRLALTAPDKTPVKASSIVFDESPRTRPPARANRQGAELHLSTPLKGHWLHVRVQLSDGTWTDARHLPLTTGTPIALPVLPKKSAKPGAPPPPFISYRPSDHLCFNDFEWSRTPGFPEQQQGEFGVRRSSWVLQNRHDGATGLGSSELVAMNGKEAFAAFFRRSDWHPRRWPMVAFDYKILQKETALALTFLTSGGLGVVEWTNSLGNNHYYNYKRVRAQVLGNAGPAIQDGNWHHVVFDLRRFLCDFYGKKALSPAVTVREFGTWACSPLSRKLLRYDNPPGARVRIDNFTLYSKAGRDPAFTWAVRQYSGAIMGYSWLLDQQHDSVPQPKIRSVKPQAAFRNIAPGVWYFHVRAVGVNQQWGKTAHRRIEITPQLH